MPEPRARLLIVDDDRAITSTLSPLLRDMADVDTAHTVAEALERLASHAYSGAVLDVVLGDDAAPLHDALSSREVPTLLFSGRDPAALERIASARGWAFAAKPISPTVLRGLVADLLGVEEPEPTQRGARVTQTPTAPTPDTSKTTTSAPVAVQLLDKLGDMVAMIAVTYLCAAGKLSGELAAAVVAGIAGVGTGIRAFGGRNVGAASAAVALAALITAAPAEVHAAPSNRGTRPHAALPGALAALALLLTLVGCASTGTMPDGPATTIRKVQSWWDAVCGTGHAAFDLAARTVTVVPGADASPGAPADASTEADQ